MHPRLQLDVICACFFVYLTVFSSQPPPCAADDTVHTSAVAMVQERARLPCDVTSTIANDRVVLILWYRGAAGTPIYSFDARGSSIEKGKHWSDEMLLEQRAYFKFLPGNSWGSSAAPGAHLEIYPVQDRDQARYRCRVDYLLSPTKNTIINFTVIIPPNKPEIFNESGQLVTTESGASIIGPYNEDDPLDLTCKVLGGRPPPKVEWLVNDEVWATEDNQDPGGVIQLEFSIARLSRKHLHAVFECRATNFNESTPVSSTVTLDMNFQPMNVSIMSSSNSLSASTEYELTCQAWGSRPPAVISWWKGGTQPLKDAVMTTSPDSNVTTSILKYKAEMTDSGKYLTCRAENAFIAQSSREDGIKLNIFYKPVVTLQMGSNLDPETIKEGDDVYFECHINANPEVQQVLWYHNGSPVEHRVLQGIIIQNQTLVLQKIIRDSAGFYTCEAKNLEGDGESQPVELKVQYKPYCKRHSKTIYGTALHEPASVTCEVEANPGPVTFRWTFNNTSEHLPIPASAVTSQDFTSIASYAPKSQLDYGTLLCWAFNSIGEQANPCAFTIIAAGPPDPPKNCTIANQTTDAIQVSCTPGFDGGLTQIFYMEVYDSTTGALHRNLSSSEPFFVLTALRPGIAFLMMTYAANGKGRSPISKLETFTLKVAEKRTGPPTLFEFTPVLGILIGVVLALILTALVIMVVMKMRRPIPTAAGNPGSRDEFKGDLENKPLNVGVLASRVKEGPPTGGGGVDPDDKNPDIIPHKTDVSYQDYEAIDRGSKGMAGTNLDSSVTIRTLPRTFTSLKCCFNILHHHRHSSNHLFMLQPKEPSPVKEVTYAEPTMILTKAQPGYQVSGTDLCLFAAKRRSAYLPLIPTTSAPAVAHSTPLTSTVSVSSASSPMAENRDGAAVYATVQPIIKYGSRSNSPHLYSPVEHLPQSVAAGSIGTQNGGHRASLTNLYACVNVQPASRRSVHIPATTSHVYATITRPRSTATVDSIAAPNLTNIYATIDRSKAAGVLPNKRNSYVTLGNWSPQALLSPSDSQDKRGTASRHPGGRSIPYESAV
ncbi:LOW QUALITY PROTEIN: nephrin-like [Macrobrachium nipponense]|uniref:LOW QUALITY PROTEIN: nephrin-like n=1 Tax=Macrobrachium nipponense TaxID=159736 RepID=UPI0030C7A5CF